MKEIQELLNSTCFDDIKLGIILLGLNYEHELKSLYIKDDINSSDRNVLSFTCNNMTRRVQFFDFGNFSIILTGKGKIIHEFGEPYRTNILKAYKKYITWKK